MKYLVIAEKPSVRQEIAKVWHKATSIDADFDNFFGHLMGLQTPDMYDPKYADKKDASILPMIPDPFIYSPSEGKEDKVKELSDKIKSGAYDCIVNACDADREGESIFWSFYSQMGLKVPTKRLWVQDTTEKGYIKAIKSLLDEKSPELLHLRDSAFLRAKMDWLYGMNYSRAASIAVKSSLPIGRVMTPTLAILAEREKAITEFKPTPYYELIVTCHKKTDKELFEATCLVNEKSTKFLKREDAEKISSSLKSGLKVDSVESTEQRIFAPTLFSLTELQKETNKKFGFSANQTLALAQSLYEKHKLISYPRSECRYIPTNLVKEIPARLSAAAHISLLKPFVDSISQPTIDKVLSTKKYVDDSKLASHYAIIPTDKVPEEGKLTSDELNLYTLIAKRLIALFLGPYVAEKTRVILVSSAGSEFLATGKVEKEKGYSVLYTDKSTDKVLPPLTKGEVVIIKDKRIEDKETVPPKRYTDDSLLEAMLTAGSKLKKEEFRDILKEVSGIGTPATRAGIIEKILKFGWAEKKGKAFYVTPFGLSTISVLGERSITSPALTAEWELKLRKIEEGKKDASDVYTELLDALKKETKDLLAIKGSLTSKEAKSVGKCPKCGSPVVEGKSYYLCSNYKKSCDFIFGKEVLKAKITLSDAKALLAGKSIRKNLTFEKDGKKSKAEKTLTIKEGKLVYVKSEVKTLSMTCPYCGGKVLKTDKSVFCENAFKGEADSCGFKLPSPYCGHEFTEEELVKLIKGGKLEALSLISKDGNPFEANLSFDLDDGIRMEFLSYAEAIEKHKKEMPKVGKCACGADVLESTNVYICSAYSDSGCNFKFPKTFCGAEISPIDIGLMLNGGHSNVKKFTFKSGKTGKATIGFDYEGKVEFHFENKK